MGPLAGVAARLAHAHRGTVRALRERRLTDKQQQVYEALMAHEDVWPRTIERETGLPSSTVRRALAVLCKQGLAKKCAHGLYQRVTHPNV